MSRLEVPIIATVIGEGGSGGALALGVADRVNMLENAVYSVITVEGCAAILWKDGKSPEMREKAASALRITAQDLLELRVIDEIIPEPPGGAHADHEATAQGGPRHARAPARRAAPPTSRTSSSAGGARSSCGWGSSRSEAPTAVRPDARTVRYRHRMSHLIEVAFKGNRKEFFLWDGRRAAAAQGAPVIVDADRGEDLGRRARASASSPAKRNAGTPHGCGDAGARRRRRARLATPTTSSAPTSCARRTRTRAARRWSA